MEEIENLENWVIGFDSAFLFVLCDGLWIEQAELIPNIQIWVWIINTYSVCFLDREKRINLDSLYYSIADRRRWLISKISKMKSNSNHKQKCFYSQISPEERRLIKQVLSPLELSALRHNYQPFNYKCEGNFIYISVPACKQLLTRAKTQLSFFTNRLQIERESQRVPRRLREVFEDPAEILSLPVYTRNHLCRLECYTMLRIMILGRKYFLERKEFGKKSMQIMDDLFKRYKCGHLFR